MVVPSFAEQVTKFFCFFSSRRRHTRFDCDWSSDVCSSDLTLKDFMVGKRIGGINVFGGGLALYDADGTLVGGLGVSGDASCADHNIAWKMRYNLRLDHVPAGGAGKGQGGKIKYQLPKSVRAPGGGPPRGSAA